MEDCSQPPAFCLQVEPQREPGPPAWPPSTWELLGLGTWPSGHDCRLPVGHHATAPEPRHQAWRHSGWNAPVSQRTEEPTTSFRWPGRTLWRARGGLFFWRIVSPAVPEPGSLDHLQREPMGGGAFESILTDFLQRWLSEWQKKYGVWLISRHDGCKSVFYGPKAKAFLQTPH